MQAMLFVIDSRFIAASILLSRQPDSFAPLAPCEKSCVRPRRDLEFYHVQSQYACRAEQKRLRKPAGDNEGLFGLDKVANKRCGET